MGSSRSMSCTCKIQCCNCVLVQDIEAMNQTNHLSWRNLPIPIFICELDYIYQFHKQQPVKIGKGHLLNMKNNLLFDCAWAWNTRQFVMSFYTTHPHWTTYMFNDLKDACLATCSIHWLSSSDQVLTYMISFCLEFPNRFITWVSWFEVICRCHMYHRVSSPHQKPVASEVDSSQKAFAHKSGE